MKILLWENTELSSLVSWFVCFPSGNSVSSLSQQPGAFGNEKALICVDVETLTHCLDLSSCVSNDSITRGKGALFLWHHRICKAC